MNDMTHEYTSLVQRLNGEYRIPIMDGLGAAGGEEPANPNEFVRTFETPPIQKEAANVIDRLVFERDEALDAYHSNDGMEGAVCSNIRDMLNSQNVPLAAFIDDHVANAIIQRNISEHKVDTLTKMITTAPKYDSKTPDGLSTFLNDYETWLQKVNELVEDQ
jgi:hypothetical protein